MKGGAGIWIVVIILVIFIALLFLGFTNFDEIRGIITALVTK